MVRVTRSDFEALVKGTLETLPRRFRRALRNVAVVVEEEPSEEDLASVGLTGEDELFGLYLGVPLGDRGHAYSALPDRIAIYRGPLLRCCRTREEVIKEVRLTVLHEFGHYFGLEDKDLAAITDEE